MDWILITGTSTGIGRAATLTLAENGYRVLAAVRKQADVESLLAEAETRGLAGSVEPIILDVTDAGQIAAAVEIVRVKIAAGGRLHAIVHNAGAQWAGPIETMPLTEWRSQFDVTFFGAIALTSSPRSSSATSPTAGWMRSSSGCLVCRGGYCRLIDGTLTHRASAHDKTPFLSPRSAQRSQFSGRQRVGLMT